MINKDFYRIFRQREYHSLKGKNNHNLTVLISILFGTFLAVGFSNGSLSYLAKKMKSPFVNWVNLSVPYNVRDDISSTLNILNSDSVKNSYDIIRTTGYHRFTMNLWNDIEKGSYVFTGRSIKLDDEVLTEIMKPSNLIHGRSFKAQDDFGLIVTKTLLEELQLDRNSLFVYWRWRLTEEDVHINIPLPIIAIVRELPGMHRFAVTPNFYSILWSGERNNPFIPQNERQLMLYLPVSVKEARSFEQLMHDFITKNNLEAHQLVRENSDTYIDGSLVTVNFFPRLTNLQVDSLHGVISQSDFFSKLDYPIYRYHDYSRNYVVSRYADYDNLSVNFRSLNHIRGFSRFLSELNVGLEMDIAQVEAKEHFDFISKLTRIISLALIIFSVYAVSLFLKSVMRMHFEKIKMNLGTFLAFGIGHNVLKKTYMSLMMRFVVIALLVSLLLAYILGSLGVIRLMIFVFNMNLEPGENYFIFWNFFTLFSVVLIFLSSTYSLNRILNKYLSKPPGKLIYNRE